jgi:hypothetical protein
VHARRHGPLRPTRIGHERDDVEAWQGTREGDEFRRVGHLRQQRGRHEAAHLDLADAGSGLGCDPGLLGLERHDTVDGLQPVARADLADQDIRHGTASR